MAKGDRRANPFGWLILGFLFGVVATLLFLMFISGEPAPSTPPEPEEEAVVSAPPAAAKPAPRPAPAPVVVERPAPAPVSPEDAQIAEDAAASGMTARKPRP